MLRIGYRLIFRLCFVLAATLPTGALACADIGCTAHWTLNQVEYGECNNLPFFSPGNDTRVNLQFLMQDLSPRKTNPEGMAKLNQTANITTALLSLDDLNSALDPKWQALPVAKPATSKLMAEEDGAHDFAAGEGSRCLSNAQGKAAFLAAVNAAPGLSATDRAQLAKLRQAWTPDCTGTGSKAIAPGLAPVTSQAAQPFATYLRAAAAFYDGEFDHALGLFQSLTPTTDPWLAESARYMIGRTLLNKAQVGAFGAEDGQALPKVADTAALKGAEAALASYLRTYPNGLYSASARGLIRRLYWLSGDTVKLTAEYGWLMRHGSDPQNNADGPGLAAEIDAKFISATEAKTHTPELLAVLDLLQMRRPEPNTPSPFPLEKLDAQAADFKGREDLFAYLKAARSFYVDKDPRATLAALGPERTGALTSYLDFSREVLRGEALTQMKDPGASAFWIGLIPRGSQPWQRETAELGLAMTYQQEGTINKVFAPQSPVRSPRIREILLRNLAGPILLRQAAEASDNTPRERDLARFVLLYKEATRGHYSGFSKDFRAATPPEPDQGSYLGEKIQLGVFNWAGQAGLFACDSLKATIAALATNPKSPSALLCLSDFVRVNRFDTYELDTPPPEQELGGGKSIFPGAAFSRGEIYKALIADPATPANEKAYALYRAINCYGPSGYNGCGGVEVDKKQRKAWFQALKSTYGDSAYAKALKFYW